jgi:hypothetical protein
MEEDTDRKGKRRYSDVGDWIARVGVPAAIAFVLLFQTNAKLDKLVAGVEKLAVMMEAKK